MTDFSFREVVVSNTLVQARIDAETKDRAAAVLGKMGLTVSDAVRIMLTRTANEGALPLELVLDKDAHLAWFSEKVRQALDDDRPGIDNNDVRDRFSRRRAAAFEKIQKDSA